MGYYQLLISDQQEEIGPNLLLHLKRPSDNSDNGRTMVQACRTMCEMSKSVRFCVSCTLLWCGVMWCGMHNDFGVNRQDKLRGTVEIVK